MMQMAKYAIYISSNITRCSVVWQMGHPSRRNENLCDIRSKYISLSIPFSRGIRFGLFLAPSSLFLSTYSPSFVSFTLCFFSVVPSLLSLYVFLFVFSVLLSFLLLCCASFSFCVLLPLLRSIFLSSSLSPTFYALLSLSSFSLFICLFLFLFLCLFCSSFSVAIISFFSISFSPRVPHFLCVRRFSFSLCLSLFISLYF